MFSLDNATYFELGGEADKEYHMTMSVKWVSEDGFEVVGSSNSKFSFVNVSTPEVVIVKPKGLYATSSEDQIVSIKIPNYSEQEILDNL